MNKKLLIIGLIVIGIVLIGGILAWQYWGESQKDKTVSWKTYWNEEYNFEVQYLKSWYIYKDTIGHIVISTFAQDKYEKYFGTDEHTKLGKNSGAILMMGYSKDKSIEAKIESIKQNIKEKVCGVSMECEKFIAEETNVDGKKSYRIYYSYYESSIMYEKGTHIIYLFLDKNGEGVFQFEGDFAGEDWKIYEKYGEEFDQMLSTFKFIE